MMDNINGIVLSLDITNEKKALSLATKLEPFIDGIKVGYPLILSCGLQIIKQLSRIKPIISDLKIADIPNTNKIICKQIFESGSESIIIHGFTGMDSILACNKIANEYSSYIFIVVEMSHNTGNIYFND